VADQRRPGAEARFRQLRESGYAGWIDQHGEPVDVEAWLRVNRPNYYRPLPPPTAALFADGSVDVAEVREQLAKMSSVGFGMEYMESLQLDLANLQRLADNLGVDFAAEDTATVVACRIVGDTVGARTVAAEAEPVLRAVPPIETAVAEADATVSYADQLAAHVEHSPDPAATRAAELAVRHFPNAAEASQRVPQASARRPSATTQARAVARKRIRAR
jgi:hypothetical protein